MDVDERIGRKSRVGEERRVVDEVMPEIGLLSATRNFRVTCQA